VTLAHYETKCIQLPGRRQMPNSKLHVPRFIFIANYKITRGVFCFVVLIQGLQKLIDPQGFTLSKFQRLKSAF